MRCLPSGHPGPGVAGLRRHRPGSQRNWSGWTMSWYHPSPRSGTGVFPVSYAREPSREAVVVQELAARYPAHMPLPVAVDPHQNWLLLADVGPDLRGTPDSQVWAEALYTFGRLQRATATQVDDLLGLDCRDRRLDTMIAHLETLVQDAEVAVQLQA